MGIDVKSSAAAEEQKLPLCNLSLASERTCYLFTRLSDEKHCIALIATDHAFDFWEAKCPREEEIFAVHVNTSYQAAHITGLFLAAVPEVQCTSP